MQRVPKFGVDWWFVEMMALLFQWDPVRVQVCLQSLGWSSVSQPPGSCRFPAHSPSQACCRFSGRAGWGLSTSYTTNVFQN